MKKERTSFISVGIDVGADFSEMSVALPNYELAGKPYKLIHSKPKSLRGAVERIQAVEQREGLCAKIFLESTGIYHYPLYYYFKGLGYEIFVLNPLITHANQNINIRKVHNDKLDSQKVVRLGLRLRPDLKTSVIPNDLVLNIRNLSREYFNLQRERTHYVNRLKAQLRQVFPQYLKVFSKVTGAASLKLLEEYTSPERIRSADRNELVSVISTAARRGRAAAEKTCGKLLAAAQDAATFGHGVDSSLYLIRHFVGMIRTLDAKAGELLDQVKQILKAHPDEPFAEQVHLLQTIPGVGFLCAVTLVCEIGDFRAFRHPKQLYSYFGLDPAVKQFGNFVGTDVRLSKRGSGYARRMIYISAMQSIGSTRTGRPKNSVLKDYYSEKCKSKTKMTAIGAVMHKVSNIIFAVLRDNSPFSLITPEEHRKAFASPDRFAACFFHFPIDFFY